MNPYVSSKFQLSKQLSESPSINFTHFRINTWYGGEMNDKRMLIGRLEESLRTLKPLEISSGLQIREYHHILDDCFSILRNLTETPTRGILEISSGRNTTIRQMCKEVLANFNAEYLLRIGAVTDPLGDNYNNKILRSFNVKHDYFRDPILGITNYMKTLLSV
jgi:nucleoside-diphosphate-sugar epimerase